MCRFITFLHAMSTQKGCRSRLVSNCGSSILSAAEDTAARIKMNLTSGALTASFIKANFRLASFIKSVPFELQKENPNYLRVFPQKWKIILWYICNILVYGYAFFESVALLKELVSNGLSARLFMLILYFAIHLMNMLFYSILLTSRPEDFVHVYNCLQVMIERERCKFTEIIIIRISGFALAVT